MNCEACGKRVRDKFLLGTLHICLPEVKGVRNGTTIKLDHSGDPRVWLPEVGELIDFQGQRLLIIAVNVQTREIIVDPRHACLRSLPSQDGEA